MKRSRFVGIAVMREFAADVDVCAQEFNANLEKENQRNRYLARKIRKPIMELAEMMDEDEEVKDDKKIKELVIILAPLFHRDSAKRPALAIRRKPPSTTSHSGRTLVQPR